MNLQPNQVDRPVQAWPSGDEGPLSRVELQQLESTWLPALERHHLRLLAHGLRTLQQIAGRRSGPPPSPATITAWLESHTLLRADPQFQRAFAAQLTSTAHHLGGLGVELGRETLSLELDDLRHWAEREAQQRVVASVGNPSSSMDP